MVSRGDTAQLQDISTGLPFRLVQQSICRATRTLCYLAEELDLITYRTEYDPEIGCYLPRDITFITFTPRLFEVLEVSPETLASVRKSRAECLNLQRMTQGKPRIAPG
ncbi:RepA family replication protein [Klebsiella aerogenes]